MNAQTYPHIGALMARGGHIMVGHVKPVPGAAIAHDIQQTLAMLRQHPGEAVDALLARLDAAIATAERTGTRVDEINTAGAPTRVRYVK